MAEVLGGRWVNRCRFCCCSAPLTKIRRSRTLQEMYADEGEEPAEPELLDEKVAQSVLRLDEKKQNKSTLASDACEKVIQPLYVTV